MKTINRLNREFFSQDFSEEEPYAEWLERYKAIACNYARMENAIAVLSDMRDNASYVYYGGFSQTLGMDRNRKEGRLPSIWEEEIFRLIHPDDLSGKHLQELRFFHFTKHRPKKERSDYYLASRLRMRNATGDYVPVLHRMFYIPSPCDDTLRLALCLYGPLLLDIPGQCVIIHSASGHIVELGKQDNTRILSARESDRQGTDQQRHSRNAFNQHSYRQPAQAGNLRQATGRERHRSLPGSQRIGANLNYLYFCTWTNKNILYDP